MRLEKGLKISKLRNKYTYVSDVAVGLIEMFLEEWQTPRDTTETLISWNYVCLYLLSASLGSCRLSFAVCFCHCMNLLFYFFELEFFYALLYVRSLHASLCLSMYHGMLLMELIFFENKNKNEETVN